MGEQSATPAKPVEPRGPKPIQLPKLLIGEGVDEVNFFNALLKHLGIQDVAVEQYGGKNNLGAYLGALKARTGFSQLRALGITRDADESTQGVFQSISGNLAKHDLAIPGALNQIAAGVPAVIIFVLPDCARSGMLEDLCWDSVGDHAAMPCVAQYFECVEKAGRIPGNMSKARVHAWLASMKDPDKRLGEAALSEYWQFDHQAFNQIRTFLSSL